MSRGPDAGTLLANALTLGGPEVTVTAREATPWASATFAGARHKITLEAPRSSALDIWLEQLPETEFALRGHLVADLVVVGVSRLGERVEARLEVLTVAH